MKTNTFSAFIGPIITLLPAIFVASSGGFSHVGFCLLTTLSLFLCYAFATNGLIASVIILSTSLYFLDLQLVWAFGIMVALFSGLIVTSFSWNPTKIDDALPEPSDSLKAILVEVKKNLADAIIEKNALKQQLLTLDGKKVPDVGSIKIQLEEKTQMLSKLKQEFFTVKSKLETFKKDQDQDRLGVQNRLLEKDKLLDLYKKQETEFLSLLKKENQRTPTE